MKEQGKRNADLELQDENASLRAKLDAVNREVAGIAAPVVELASSNPGVSEYSNALKAQERELTGRFRQICEAYLAAGYGDEFFPLLTGLLFDLDYNPSQARGIFEAAAAARASDPERKNHDDEA